MSLHGGHKRCAEQQVWNAHDWPELYKGCVHKRDHRAALRAGGTRHCTFERPVSKQVTEPQAKREVGWTVFFCHINRIDSPAILTLE